MISLSLNVGEIIRKSIIDNEKRLGILPLEELKNVYNKQNTFFEKELSLVSTLTVNREVLEIINLFPNVLDLTIDSSEQFTTKEINFIIQSFPNLKKLTIKNQDNLQVLNLSNLYQLEELNITSNDKLFKMTNLEELSNLEKLTFYNNNLFSSISINKLVNYIKENKDKSFNIDVLYFKDVFPDLPSNIVWSEFLKEKTLVEHLTYNNEEMLKVYKKALSIINKYLESGDTDEEKFAILYEWLTKNVTYDFASLKNTNNKKLASNGTVGAFLDNKAVCQGYTKAMQFFLKILNIPSLDISCVMDDDARKRKSYSLDGRMMPSYADHSIIKVRLSNNTFYNDISSDSIRAMFGFGKKYVLMSKDEIEKTHKLVGQEETLAYKSISDEERKKLEEFACHRIKKREEENISDKGGTMWHH